MRDEPPRQAARDASRRPDARARDRDRLGILGVGFAVIGMASLSFAIVGLGRILPPVFGQWLTVLGAGALGAIFLSTGVLYMAVARGATEPALSPAGVALSTDRKTGSPQWIAWSSIGRARVSGWRMSPWISNPRFFEVEVTPVSRAGGGARTAVVHIDALGEFAEGMRAELGDRFEFAAPGRGGTPTIPRAA